MIIKTAINRSIINVIIDTNLCNLNPFIKQCYRIAWSVEKIQKAIQNPKVDKKPGKPMLLSKSAVWR